MFKSRQEFEEALVKAVEQDLSKAKDNLKTKLQAHPDVGEVDVEHNHPDYPGHDYVSVHHTHDANDHVDRVLQQHGKIVQEGTPYRVEHDLNGKSQHESQYIIKPHVAKAKQNNSQ